MLHSHPRITSRDWQQIRCGRNLKFALSISGLFLALAVNVPTAAHAEGNPMGGFIRVTENLSVAGKALCRAFRWQCAQENQADAQRQETALQANTPAAETMPDAPMP
jgi:hypothetical protein